MARCITLVVAAAVLTALSVSCSGDSEDSTKMTEVRKFRGMKSSSFSVTFTPDGASVVAGGHDGVWVWNENSGKLERRFADAPLRTDTRELIGCLDVSVDGRTILTGGQIREGAFLWRLEDGQQLHHFNTIGRVESVDLSNDGTFAFAGTGFRASVTDRNEGNVYAIHQWDLATQKEVRSMEGHLAPVTGVGVLLDGKRLLSASEDQTLRLWDLQTGRESRQSGKAIGPRISQSNDRSIISGDWPKNRIPLSVSHNGRYAIWGWKLWDVEQWKQIGRLVPDFKSPDYKRGMTVFCGAFSPDDRYMLVGYQDGKVKLWDVATCKELTFVHAFANHAEVYSVAFSPDGNFALRVCPNTSTEISRRFECMHPGDFGNNRQ